MLSWAQYDLYGEFLFSRVRSLPPTDEPIDIVLVVNIPDEPAFGKSDEVLHV